MDTENIGENAVLLVETRLANCADWMRSRCIIRSMAILTKQSYNYAYMQLNTPHLFDEIAL